MNNINNSDWQRCKSPVFWGEIAPCDHVVQIYETDEVFIEALAGFVGDGINAGDCVIVIATKEHTKALDTKLTNCGIHINSLKSNGGYIALDAEETLSQFMVNNWPDEYRFNRLLTKLFEKARKGGRKVRAFGEMVAILWANGHNGATVHLEHLWNKFCSKEPFPLFCAYPKSGFTDNLNDSFQSICCSHTKMLSGGEKQMSEVFYRDINPQQTAIAV